MPCRQLLVHASLGIKRRTKLQGARKAAWIWLRGKPLLAAYKSFRLSQAKLQRSRFHAGSKLRHSYKRGQLLPEGRRMTEMRHLLAAVTPKQLCHGSHRKTSVP